MKVNPVSCFAAKPHYDFLAVTSNESNSLSKSRNYNIPIKLNKRNGDNSNLIFGSETNAHETAPTQGSVGISRNLTHNSPSMSKSRTPTGTTMGMMPNFSESINNIRAPPVYRRPIWYLRNIERRYYYCNTVILTTKNRNLMCAT